MAVIVDGSSGCVATSRGHRSRKNASRFAPDGRRLAYSFKRTWKDGSYAVILEPLDLIARLAALIPPPKFHMRSDIDHDVHLDVCSAHHHRRGVKNSERPSIGLCIALATSCFSALACDSETLPAEIEFRSLDPLAPPADSIEPTLLTDETRGRRMFAPPYRSTIDGRVGVYARDDHTLCLDALAPEQFAEGELPMSQRSGSLARNDPLELDMTTAFGGFKGTIRDPVICEGHWNFADSDCNEADESLPKSRGCHGRFYEWSDSQNPYIREPGDPIRSRCPQAPGVECYELTLMFIEDQLRGEDQLWSVTAQVTVTDAKTPTAKVSAVLAGQAPPQELTFADESALDRSDLRSPSVTGDGRLLVMSAGSDGLVYAYNAGTPCTPAGWEDAVVQRLSSLRADADMVTDQGKYRYGLATVAFRDSRGGLIPLGQPLHGGAPWIDRRGSNLLFAAAQAAPYDETRATLELHAEPGDLLTETWIDAHCGASFAEVVTVEGKYNVAPSVMGSWTDGKIVSLDGGFGQSELAIDFAELEQCACEPGYECTQLEEEIDRLRTGRTSEESTEYFATAQTLTPSGGASGSLALGETAIHAISSLENRFHHQASARPSLPRDLVGLLSSDHATREIAFDDYMSVDNLIVANMVPSITSGAHRVVDPQLIANEATWRLHSRARLYPPGYGSFTGASFPRVEPFAIGGVHGHGIYLDGSNGVEFILDDKGLTPRPNQTVRLSLWVRPDDVSPGQPRQWLLWGPDGTVVSLLTPSQGPQRIRVSKFADGSWWPVDFTIPVDLELVAGKWSHIGFVSIPSACGEEVVTLAQGNGPDSLVESGDSIIELFVDGTLVDRRERLRPNDGDECEPTGELVGPHYFRLAEGTLRVGTGNGGGLAGWIDELRLSALYPGGQNYEQLCNLAYGSLEALSEGEGWASIRAEAHTPILDDILANTGSVQGLPPSPRFICDVRDERSTAGPRVLRDPRFDALTPGPCVARVDTDQSPPTPARDTNGSCVDELLVYPEGPLTLGDPRPDSSIGGAHNRACVGCHIIPNTLSDAIPNLLALGVAVDDLGDVSSELPACADRRRQPSQPPARIFGRLPADLEDCAARASSTLPGSLRWWATDGCPLPPSGPITSPRKTCPAGGGHEPDPVPPAGE